MSNIILTIDEDTLSVYSNALQRVMAGEDINDDRSDLAFIIEGMKEFVDSNIEEEIEVPKKKTKYKYNQDPEKVAKLWLGRKKKTNKEKMLADVICSYREIGQEFCEEIVDIVMEKNPQNFVETSGGEVGDEIVIL